jgi:preprotein translocase subunit SecA
LEKAQKKVEARNFDTRKNVLKYDDVMNSQRREVYEQRREFMKATDVSETVADMRAEVIDAMVARRIPAKAFSEQWESEQLAEDVRTILAVDLPIVAWAAEDGIDEEVLRERIIAASDAQLAEKTEQFGLDLMRFIEKSVLLQNLDAVWKEHLLALDQLRQGIGLRAYGQRDPLNEYKSEAFALFNAMLDDLKERVTKTIAGLQLQAEVPAPPPMPTMWENHPEAVLEGAMDGPLQAGAQLGGSQMLLSTQSRPEIVASDDPTTWGNTPRNAPCPCGSGKKYKHCHGKA